MVTKEETDNFLRSARSTARHTNACAQVRQEFAEALAQVFERHLRLHPLTILDQLLVSVAGLCIAHTVNVESAIEVLRECHRRTLQRDLESAVDPKELS